MRQIFLDTETTGLIPDSGDRIIEIGCLEMVNRRLTGNNKHFYLNPERPNSEGAFAVHGLSDEFLADKPRFAEIADELLAYLAGAEVVIHNAAFDVGFLDAEMKRIARPPMAGQVARITDSLLMARNQFPGKSNSLDALCKRLEVDNTSRTLHGALLDAGLLAEVYVRMTRGQDSLVIEVQEGASGALGVAAIDLSSVVLAAVAVSADEQAAHEAVLAALDKASGGQTLWRRLA
ncbi:MAG: DNA polymerase III subunit epsilon [Burkholderiaceae bacterium]|nr:DNA polymerase III subunit epsilon [Burkholderiaceae bacterium]